MPFIYSDLLPDDMDERLARFESLSIPNGIHDLSGPGALLSYNSPQI